MIMGDIIANHLYPGPGIYDNYLISTPILKRSSGVQLRHPIYLMEHIEDMGREAEVGYCRKSCSSSYFSAVSLSAVYCIWYAVHLDIPLAQTTDALIRPIYVADGPHLSSRHFCLYSDGILRRLRASSYHDRVFRLDDDARVHIPCIYSQYYMIYQVSNHGRALASRYAGRELCILPQRAEMTLSCFLSLVVLSCSLLEHFLNNLAGQETVPYALLLLSFLRDAYADFQFGTPLTSVYCMRPFGSWDTDSPDNFLSNSIRFYILVSRNSTQLKRKTENTSEAFDTPTERRALPALDDAFGFTNGQRTTKERPHESKRGTRSMRLHQMMPIVHPPRHGTFQDRRIMITRKRHTSLRTRNGKHREGDSKFYDALGRLHYWINPHTIAHPSKNAEVQTQTYEARCRREPRKIDQNVPRRGIMSQANQAIRIEPRFPYGTVEHPKPAKPMIILRMGHRVKDS
ncbi:hypothetical protein CCUS01_13332 [Colletotrichum cuscutae]|uniref:Uncharacterized protein n=1 Tax=Colletotrichum cuscutae TaxID=1209917 RepID=A0AAJ0DNS7_9PEZI|nr:hypothetical protein CCUS01_13332 [Colletotrichum cuscutae]